MRLWLSLGLLYFSQGAGFGCICGGGTPPCEEYWNAAVVFSGTVARLSPMSIEEKFGERIVSYSKLSATFNVETVYRGEIEKEVDVITGMSDGDCGYRFQIGERYLVYAFVNEQTKRLQTSSCARTRPMSEASADLEFFRGIAQNPAGGRIYGEIADFTRDSAGTMVEKNLAGANVSITGEGTHIERTSDKEGRYEVAGLRPGQYRIGASFPDYTSTSTKEAEVAVHDRGCVHVAVPLQLDGRIMGRVLDSEANGVVHQRIELVPVGRGITPEFTTYSDEDGKYELKGVRPGDYYLGINLSNPPSAESPYVRTYFPDIHERERAPVIHVDRAETLTDRDIYLRTLCKPRLVTGIVLWPDGRPAASASMMLSSAEYSWHSNSPPQPDEQGRFSFTVLSGLHSFLWIQAQDSNGRWLNAGKIELQPDGELKPVVAILSQAPPARQ